MPATGNIAGYLNIFFGWKLVELSEKKLSLQKSIIKKKKRLKKRAVFFENISANFKS